MVSFNSRQKSGVSTTLNYEGEKAYKADSYLDLYLRTATQLVMTEKFYGDKNKQYQEWLEAVHNMIYQDPEYLLRLAAYVRNELKLRTAPIVMLTETVMEAHANGNNHKIYELVRKYAPYIIQRADEPAEIIAYYKSCKGDIGNHTPGKNGLHKTLKTIINNALLSDKFTPYQLIKHDSNTASVKLRDVLRICHPKVKDQQTSEFFRKIVKQESVAEYAADETWEGIISRDGSNTESWSNAIKIMPIFALVRNIRNIFDNSVPYELIHKHLITKLRDENVIRKSRMLPFRFYQAYKEMKGRNHELDGALEQAILISTLNNIPKLEGTTAVFVDLSGSMSNPLNSNSSMKYAEISALFGSIVYKANGQNNVLLCGYQSNVIPIKAYENDSVFHIMNQLLQHLGGGTEAYRCIQLLIDNKLSVDNIMFFSDEQSYHSNWGGKELQKYLQDYRRQINPEVVLYDVDLSGYGSLQFEPNNNKNIMMGGWSERVFDLMNVVQNGKKGNIRELLEKIYP